MREAAALAATAAAVAAGCTGDGGDGDRDRGERRTVTVKVGERPAQQGDRGRERAPRGGGPKPPKLPGGGSCDGARAPTTRKNLRAAEIAIRCLTNAARQKQGLPELAFDERLARAAADRSRAMADANFFGHQGPGPSSARKEVRESGWIPDGKSWLLGENIGWAEGNATPARIVRSWLDSPRHRANIMGEHFGQIGVGVVKGVPKKGARPGATFTQIFGATGQAARAAQTG